MGTEKERDDDIVAYAQTALDRMGASCETGLNQVDSLILSWMSYLHLDADPIGPAGEAGEPHDPVARAVRAWEGVPLARLFRAECFDALFEGVWDPADTRRLLTALAASPRFRDARVCGFTERVDEEAGMQFAAVSFQLTPDLAYLAFRGTDSTLVGWREDFNLAFMTPVPAQQAAVDYLLEAAGHLTGRLVLGGHSKGGNLAVYAACACPDPEVRSRIENAYSHDGPGFLPEVLDRPDFVEMAPRVRKTIPQSSLVGLLLESKAGFDIVRSRQVSVLQHDPFSWVVERGGARFEPVERLSVDARYLDRTLNGWIAQMTPQERERMTDALYGVLSAADASTFDEIKADWRTSVPAIARAFAGLDAQTRDFLLRVLGELARQGTKGVSETLAEMLPAGLAAGPAGPAGEGAQAR